MQATEKPLAKAPAKPSAMSQPSGRKTEAEENPDAEDQPKPKFKYVFNTAEKAER